MFGLSLKWPLGILQSDISEEWKEGHQGCGQDWKILIQFLSGCFRDSNIRAIPSCHLNSL
jgi:hypothetical protein